MTREEAIQTLTAHVMVAVDRAEFGKSCSDMVEEALEMAIKALEQENNVPDTNVGKIPCQDAISRSAALALAKDIHVPTGNAYVYYSHWCIDPQEIIELPSVNT